MIRLPGASMATAFLLLKFNFGFFLGAFCSLKVKHLHRNYAPLDLKVARNKHACTFSSRGCSGLSDKFTPMMSCIKRPINQWKEISEVGKVRMKVMLILTRVNLIAD